MIDPFNVRPHNGHLATAAFFEQNGLLNGVVIDNSPVDVVFHGSGETVLEAARNALDPTVVDLTWSGSAARWSATRTARSCRPSRRA